MNKDKTIQFFRWLFIALILSLTAIFTYQSALAVSLSDASSPVPPAALKLVQFCADPESGLDLQAVSTLVNYVVESKSNKEDELPKIQEAPGAYFESEIKIDFPSFLQYSYGDQIPSALTNPASLRYSQWIELHGETQKKPAIWKLLSPGSKPFIIYGLQRNSITPDLNTGVYYEYNLKRALILINHKGKNVIISISKQIDTSDIGKKGVILGNDEDWNYYYSGIPGSTRIGLGWIKSYIYDFFSVVVHIEASTLPPLVKSGIFQWLRAGWSGINFVQTSHIIKGMKRNAKSSKAVLESPNLPAPNQIIATYQRLANLQKNDLTERYIALQQARQSMAVLRGKINLKDVKKQDFCNGISKDQIIEELMLEYLKSILGKSSLLGQQVVLGIN